MVNVHIHEFVQGAVDDASALEQFQKQWTSYQKLVDNDYLSHREVGALLHSTLDEVMTGPFSFLDIACGDAGQIPYVLGGTAAAHYHGIDLAEPAIELAAANLKNMPFEVDLDHRDFVEALADRPEPAGATWCGLSIHHLQPDGKLRLMKAIRAATNRAFLIYEPTRREDEDRAAFMDRFVKVNSAAWTALSADE